MKIERIAKKYILSHVLSIFSIFALNIIWSMSGPTSIYFLNKIVENISLGQTILFNFILYLCLKFFSDTGGILISYFRSIYEKKMSNETKKSLFKYIKECDYKDKNALTYQSIIEKINMVDAYVSSIFTPIFMLINVLISVVLSVIYILKLSPMYLSILVLPVPVWLIINMVLNKTIKQEKRKLSFSTSRKHDKFLSILGNAESLVAFNHFQYEKERYTEIHKLNYKNSIKIFNLNKFRGLADILLNEIPILLILILSIYVLGGRSNELISVYLAIGYIYKPFYNFEQIIISFFDINIRKTRINELFSFPLLVDGNIHYSGHNSILYSLHNVSFNYGGNDVLKEVTINIKKNDCVAIVGKSGSGKTTLINLLLAQLKPTSGKLYIDGILTENINQKSYIGKVAYMNQQPTIFSTSIKDNILLGNSDKKLNESIKEANLFEDISKMENGVETLLFENGKNISGGQCQRIELARCFAKDSDIIIFDEPTSSMDVENEKIIISNIQKLKGTKTIVIITHRQSLLSLVDRVFKLENKQIKEIFIK